MAHEELKDFARKIKLRNLEVEDYDDVASMQKKCFPNMKPWRREQFSSMISIFPEGQFAIEYRGKVIASCCGLVINQSDYPETASWSELTGGGFFTNHNPLGDTYYAAEIMVDPKYRSMKLARRLYEARQDLVRRMNLARIAAGGRLPNYHKYAKKLSVYEYVQNVIDKKIYDPVLTTQLSNGFVLTRILPDYLPTDKESLGYATYLEWTNLQYAGVEKDKRRRTTPYVRVSAVQYQMRMINNFAEFAANCEYFIDVASDYRCDFVLFPEMLTMQLLSFLPEKNPAKAIRLLNVYTEQYLEAFSNLSVKYNINIVGGTHFMVEDGNLYNVAHLFRRDGTIAKQYKIHITPSEKKWWGVQSGSKMEVFNTDRGRIAIIICYDVEFPELVRIARSKGAQIIFVPFNADERRAYLRVRYCAQARAVENQLFVVMGGCVGNLPKVENLDIHFAQSAIFTPCDFPFHREGIATEASLNTETIIFQDLDLNLLRWQKEFGTVQTYGDRKRDLYRVVYNEDGREREA